MFSHGKRLWSSACCGTSLVQANIVQLKMTPPQVVVQRGNQTIGSYDNFQTELSWLSKIWKNCLKPATWDVHLPSIVLTLCFDYKPVASTSSTEDQFVILFSSGDHGRKGPFTRSVSHPMIISSTFPDPVRWGCSKCGQRFRYEVGPGWPRNGVPDVTFES